MSGIHPEVREIIEAGPPAHLVTINTDGSPQVTIVWVGLDGDDLVTAHVGEYQKVRTVRRDSRVAVSIETGRKNDMGLDEYIVISGTARVEEGGAPELLQELAYAYMGPDVKFPPMPNPPSGVIIRTTVDRVTGVGPWGRPV
jgi:PPOX class probable F420-dependent enzyme